MLKRTLGLIILAASMLTGCGGGGGGLGVTGGSIPVGDLAGTLTLPNGQPMTSPTVAVTVLPATQVTSAGSTVNADGTFVVTNIPAGKNVELSFTESGATLKVVVPGAQVLANNTSKIGSVTALTTVVARSIEKETKNVDPATADQIVASQSDQLLTEIKGQGQSQSQQQREITDANELDKAANGLIYGTANTELAALALNPKHQEAEVALDGLIGQIGASGGNDITLSPSQQAALITAQLKQATYTSASVAAALNAAGLSTATASGVDTADAAQRKLLPAWNSISPAITPYEALAIAASPSSASGFALTSTQIEKFLTSLGV